MNVPNDHDGSIEKRKKKLMKDAVTRMLNENAFAIATVLGYDATNIGFLNSAPAMIVPDESNEYSKHFYSVRAEVNYQIRCSCFMFPMKKSSILRLGHFSCHSWTTRAFFSLMKL